MSKIHIPFIISLAWLHLRAVAPNIHKYLERFDVYKKIDTYANMKSRKARLLIAIIALATLGSFVPPLLCWLMNIITGHSVAPLVILTDGDWITVISIIVPAYMGALTWEKHIALKNGIMPSQLGDAVAPLKGIPDQKQDVNITAINATINQQDSGTDEELSKRGKQ